MYEFTKSQAAVANVAAKKTARYAINGVYFDPEHKALVATDGRRIMASRIKVDIDAKPLIVGTKDIKAAAKMLNGTPQTGAATISPDTGADSFTAARIDGKASMSGELIDGSYPDWTSCVPADAPTHQIAVDADLLRDILAAMPRVEESGSRSVILGFSDPCRPLLIWPSGTGDCDMLAALMPIAGVKSCIGEAGYQRARDRVTGKAD